MAAKTRFRVSQAWPAWRWKIQPTGRGRPDAGHLELDSVSDHEYAVGKVHILGIGDDGLEGLTRGARGLLDQADLVIGSAHTLASVGESTAQRVASDGDPEEVARLVAEHPEKHVVILATGDPLFYGTARYLCEKLGKDRFEVVPHVSSMQLAFARVKESWDEAYLTNLANQNLDRVVERIRSAERVGLFTTDEVTPARVARTLLERGIDYFTAYVCENLGSPDERVTQGELAELAEQTFGAAQRDDPGPQAAHAGSSPRAGGPPAVRQSGRGVSAESTEARSAHAGRSALHGAWRNWISGRRARCGMWARAAVRCRSKRRRSRGAARSTPSKWTWRTTS